MSNHSSFLFERLQTVSVPARKLFAVVVRQAFHGPIRPKTKGTATPPEILEACGLDVAEFYTLLAALTGAGLIEVSHAYPFEEIRLAPEAGGAEALAERCTREKIPFESVFVNLVEPPRESLQR
ncbi:MAG TPA: hypothetical protein VEJ47_11125 [Candidatus Eremiobacteraceae bacterium]|nr:hypothetical protein [Candidatus Eremiobacteraceae bacterium]